MSTPDAVDATPAIGAVVVGPDGGRIGEVVALAVGASSLRPEWLVVDVDGGDRTALPSFVASLTASGELAVPFGRDQVLQAPHVEDEVLDDRTADAVLEHYGLSG